MAGGNERRDPTRGVAVSWVWCDDADVSSLAGAQPLHVATWIEGQTETHAARAKMLLPILWAVGPSAP